MSNKNLHERIEELEDKVNCQDKKIDCINARLSLVACAAKNILAEVAPEPLREEEINEE